VSAPERFSLYRRTNIPSVHKLLSPVKNGTLGYFLLFVGAKDLYLLHNSPRGLVWCAYLRTQYFLLPLPACAHSLQRQLWNVSPSPHMWPQLWGGYTTTETAPPSPHFQGEFPQRRTFLCNILLTFVLGKQIPISRRIKSKNKSQNPYISSSFSFVNYHSHTYTTTLFSHHWHPLRAVTFSDYKLEICFSKRSQSCW